MEVRLLGEKMIKQSSLLMSLFFIACTTNKPYVLIEIKVPTIQCEMCEDNIESALSDLDGVKKILVNSQTNSVSIQYDSSVVSLKQIESVIAKTGYQANELKPDLEVYEKLNLCCKVPNNQ